jgi:putative NIF3 family GTP cyclohydrolase 1 type 2
MQASQIYDYLHSLDTGWVDWDKTVDTFKAGEPAEEVSGIAVGWMSYTWALERAVALSCNLFITHEPTYYDHLDQSERMLRRAEVQRKKRFIEENRLIILRCHDLWDQMPGMGIPDSWGELLGLGEMVAGEEFYRVYDVSGKTARQVAQQVAAHTQDFGQPGVQLIGPGDKPVRRACIGTGAITPLLWCIDKFKADLAICTDDGFTYWRDGAYALDNDLPVIVVHHHVSEEAGLRQLAKHMQERFPDVPVQHIPQRCMYTLVQGE